MVRLAFIVVLLSSASSIGVGCSEIVVPSDRCQDYCNAVIAACGTFGSGNGQYANAAACVGYCQNASGMPPGIAGAASGNSLECRITQSGKAAVDPDGLCESAGPTGGDVCGSYCDVYCQLITSNCVGSFADAAACESACAAFPSDGWSNDGDGDTVQCRITYAGLAGAERGTSVGAGHCANAMPDSAECTPPADCDAFCALVDTACTGEDQVYDDAAACEVICDEGAGWTEGKLGDTADNTVGCRHNNANRAATEADPGTKEQLCKNASMTGGGVCGDLCDNYCELMARNCSTQPDALDDAACAAACDALAVDGDPNDTSGDTVQCRMFFVANAGDPVNSGNPTTVANLCASAAVDSTVCK